MSYASLIESCKHYLLLNFRQTVDDVFVTELVNFKKSKFINNKQVQMHYKIGESSNHKPDTSHVDSIKKFIPKEITEANNKVGK